MHLPGIIRIAQRDTPPFGVPLVNGGLRLRGVDIPAGAAVGWYSPSYHFLYHIIVLDLILHICSVWFSLKGVLTLT